MDDTKTLSSGSVLKESVTPVVLETIKTTMALSLIKLILSCIGTIKGLSAAKIVGFDGKKGEEGPIDSRTGSPLGV